MFDEICDAKLKTQPKHLFFFFMKPKEKNIPSFSHKVVFPTLVLSSSSSSTTRQLSQFRDHRRHLKKKQAVEKMLQNEDYISAFSVVFGEEDSGGFQFPTSQTSLKGTSYNYNIGNQTHPSVSPYSDYGDADEEMTAELQDCLKPKTTEEISEMCREADKQWLHQEKGCYKRVSINWEELFSEYHEVERMMKEDFDVCDDDYKNKKNKAQQELLTP
jgi:hypothetical protein